MDVSMAEREWHASAFNHVGTQLVAYWYLRHKAPTFPAACRAVQLEFAP